MSSRAVKLTALVGKPEEIFELVTEEKPRASPGHVVVRMTVMPVHPTDLDPGASGIWSTLDLKDITAGGEGAGVVEEVGEGVTSVSVGQRVIPLVFNLHLYQGFGVWRDHVEISVNDVIFVPDDISDDVAGQFFINPWLVYGILKEINIPEGGYLVQNAAGSVVGSMVVQLAKHWGIKTINIVRRDDYTEQLKALGADEVINSSTEDVLTRVKEITKGNLAYGGLDPVAGDGTKMMAACVRNGGELLVYGRLSANYVTIELAELFRQVIVRFFIIDDYGHNLPKRKEIASAVFELLQQKIIEPAVGKRFQLKDFKEAMKEAQKPGRGGKVLIVN